MRNVLIWLLFLLIGCASPTEPITESIQIDARLPRDASGYYRLRVVRNRLQTFHRISGLITHNNQPAENAKVYWWSDRSWIVGDTLGFIVDQWRRDTRYYRSVYIGRDTVYMSQFVGIEVQTVNYACYSTKTGEINTVFAPVYWMVGDTVTVFAYTANEIKHISIILE